MTIYKIASDTKKIIYSDRFVYINSKIPSWIITNEFGDAILSLFDGNNSLNEILTTATNTFGEINKDIITSFCEEVIKKRVVEKIVSKRISLLHQVHLSLSENCNLQCKYCYAHERKENGENTLSFEEYKKLIEDLLKVNPQCSFTLTGGEPLLNKDWYKIAKYIKNKGCEILLLSNGTIINESNIKSIKDVIDSVKLSIDGSNKEIHALSRGDNYEKVEHAISLLEDNKVPYSLSMTVTKQNMRDVESAAKKFGNKLTFAPFFPIKEDSIADMAITGAEYFRVLKNAAGVEPLSYCASSFANAMHHQCHKCAIGDREISISATGDVYPCHLLHTEDFYCGNVREMSIIDIYNNSPTLKKCKEIDVDKIEGCKDCAFKYVCGGACRARAFYDCGDINKNGDFCDYEKSAYLDGLIKLHKENALEKKIHSVSEFLEWSKKCKNINSDHSENTITYNCVFYRGQSNESWNWSPGIFRDNVYVEERELFKQAKNQLWNNLQNCNTELEKLVRLQHFGLKTRLLDLTSNSLIALFFACFDKGQMNVDGKVSVFIPIQEDGITIAKIIADVIGLENTNSSGGYTDDILIDVCKKYTDNKNVIRELAKPQFFFAPYNNKRIIAQKGAFLIAPLLNNDFDNTSFYFATTTYDFSKEFKQTIRIDAKSKQNILDELSEIGIDESTVFPEIEHITNYLNEGGYALNKFWRRAK